MFQVPAALVQEARENTQGLRASYYLPHSKRAAIEHLQGRTRTSEALAPDITLDLPIVTQRDGFALVFEGSILIPRTGTYTFATASDDGSCLYIDGQLVVDNDGDHGMRERKGEVALEAGRHRFLLSYYDQAGGDGLFAFWEGPGVERERIPGAVFRSDLSPPLRRAAIQAMAHVPGDPRERLLDVAKLIGEKTHLEPALDLASSLPLQDSPPEELTHVLDSIAGFLSELPEKERTAARALHALEVGRGLAGALPQADGSEALKRLSGLSGQTLLLRTIPHEMKYDRSVLTVEAGKPIAIVFQNNDLMPHNLVIVKPGTMEAVGNAAELLGTQPGSEEQAFVPPTDDVLWHTSLVHPGQTTRLTFVAPKEPGNYPYVCTFPGHWRVMNGTLRVVSELTDELAQASRESPTTNTNTTVTRRFVKLWTQRDLEGAFTKNWQRGRSVQRGKELFLEAGCLKCHVLRGEGAAGAPDLSKIGTKFQGAELLKQILEPSSQILEGYENHMFELESGDTILGRLAKETQDEFHVVPDLQKPDDIRHISKDDVLDRRTLALSLMPTGLLVTFTREEILDLIAFLETGK